PAKDFSLAVTGPRAADCGDLADNLVVKAARQLAERVPQVGAGAFVLDKHLPAAAGIGGGSADAAAALRLLAQANGIAADDA
ncbi:GHMP family kinase ATP-binding protein, partial [Klebsiella pneumoniae]|uniref:GHMP family kinase ATP-binding protein n=1 Tax=Klebsiella pneumoniae TaxID=573 RepID=UPI003F78F54A